MYEELVRQMRPSERSELESMTRPESLLNIWLTLKWIAIWTACLIASGLLVYGLIRAGLVAILVVVLGPVLLLSIFCIYAIGLLVSDYIRWHRIDRRYISKVVPELRKALEDGRVVAKRVVASAVIEIEEYEDEGPGYIFDLGEGKLLFLKGQRFFPVDDSMPWPNTEFEIVRTAYDNQWLGIFCYGEKLEPIRRIPSHECRDEIVWADREELIEGDLERFADSLLKRA